MLRAPDPLDTWRRSRVHDRHSMTAMTFAVQSHFAIRSAQLAPYLYRHVVNVVDPTREAAALVESVFQEEARLGERGDIVTIGCRIVA